MNMPPLRQVVSERTRALETEIVRRTVDKAVTNANGVEVDDRFPSETVDLETFPGAMSAYENTVFNANIDDYGSIRGVRLVARSGSSCIFTKSKNL